MKKQIITVYRNETPRRRWIVLGFFLFGLIGSALEAIGLSIIFPLITIIQKPAVIHSSSVLRSIYRGFGFSSDQTFLIVLTLVVGFIFLFKSVYMFGLFFAQAKTIASWQAKMASRLFNGYLHAPYGMHLRRNSVELVRNLGLTGVYYSGFTMSCVTLTIDASVLLAVVLVLFFQQPVLTAITGGILASLMLIHYRLTGHRAARVGREGTELTRTIRMLAHQALGSIKETKILGREKTFQDSHAKLEQRRARNSLIQQVIMRVPNMSNEIVLIITLISAMVFVLITVEGAGDKLATLGLLAAAAFRLLPMYNRVIATLNNLEGTKIAVDILSADLTEAKPVEETEESRADVLHFTDAIELDGISFQYPSSDIPAINNVSTTIRQGESVGIVGTSGAGKTTLADIILGLHKPTEGHLIIDGKEVTQAPRPWQRNLGYVPQDIYILDDSVRANVAFGRQPEEIEDSDVWRALHLARLDDFIRALPEGLDTVFGERGVRLSGGQRQRLGLARALYHNPDVLILDEATSALDVETENEVSYAIQDLKGLKTLIIIAHRLSTLKRCDRLLFMKDGRLVAEGTLGELYGKVPDFKHLVELSKLDPGQVSLEAGAISE